MRLDRRKVRQRMKMANIEKFGDLAQLVGVAPQTLSSWLNEAHDPSWESFEKLCGVLSCTPNDIVSFDDPDGALILQRAQDKHGMVPA